MRTLAGTTSSGVSAAVTAPGYFVEFGWSITGRYSTRGTLTWDSQTWTATDVQVSGLSDDSASAAIDGALQFGNSDLIIGALVFAQGVAGKTVRVWAFYGDTAPGTSDPVLVFDGVADSATFADGGPVTIRIIQAATATLWIPRLYMTPDTGFNFLPADGQIVEWNGERVRLTSEGI